MNKGILFVSLAACLPGAVLADASNYSYVEGGLVGFDVDELDLFGFGIAGSYEFSEQIFARAALKSLSDEVGNIDVDYSDWALGAGYVFYTTQTSSAYAGAELVGGKLEAGPVDADGDGYALFTGLRTDINERLELNGELNYADIDDDSQISVAAGLVYALQSFDISAGLSSTEGDMGWGLGVRFSF